MAYEIDKLTITFPTAVDLSSNQYCAVTVDSNGNAVLPANGGAVVGVLQNNPKAGQMAAVRVYGVTQMVASGAINAGQVVATTASGQAKVATVETANTTSGAITGSDVVGIALDSVNAAGQYVTVLLKSMGAVPGTTA